MLRAIIVLVVFLIFEIVMLPILLILKIVKIKNKKFTKNVLYRLVKVFTNIMLKISGVKLNIDKRNLESNETYLFVSNHQSIFDILFIIKAIDIPIAFIAKKELVYLPVLRLWMKELGCIFIDRKNIKNSINEINNAVDKLKNNNSLVIFPEGTRSVDGNIGKFKPGSFKLAINSEAAVVPITINNAYKILKKGSFKINRGEASIKIGSPVCFIDYGEDNSVEISEKIREEIQKNIIF
ncbi:MAG: 1-acyl-sn-glycerol-3-phosphate acyltransferase [Clostridia bacterium]|jgi:1-acyl-sn-glycerol-3-phosphate acyltransferase|nr:1-acyl-sn-glycerol-3-phosphate acyltransferase [Clostridia bacterium]